MVYTSSFGNSTMGFNDTTTNPDNTESCPSHLRAYFETVDSSVPYTVNAVLNVLLAITTTFANLLVFLAMRHVTSIRLPSKLLLGSLVLTDLGTGFVVHPQLTAFLLIKGSHSYIGNCHLVTSLLFVATLFSSVSFLTMTAISLDRYTALFYYIRYQQIITPRRVSAVLTFIWSLSLFLAFTWLWNLALKTFITIIGIVICFLVISVAYIKIYRGLHGLVQVQAPAQTQQQAGNTFNMAKYKRTASAMLWVYALFIFCYVPLFCMNLTVSAFQYNPLTQCIYEFSVTVGLLNSCLNPFAYCLCLPEVRAEVLKQLSKICCRAP